MRANPTTEATESTRGPQVFLCRFDELASGEARRFDVGDQRIALVRIGDDVHAIGDRCTHQDVSLSKGEVYVEEAEIECVRHGSIFSLITGEALNLPANKPTPVYDVEVIDGKIYVGVDQ